MDTPEAILEKYWGYTQFRPFQKEIISAVLENHDTLAILPTGGGKSLCFQIPALLRGGICIVVSPLVSLMADQVRTLNKKGIKALMLSGGLPYQEVDRLLENCIYGSYQFLYVSPERLQQELVQERIRRMPVGVFAIDEVHCISQWGHDFRPAYTQLHVLRDLHPHVPIIALSATATPEVQEDIVVQLGMNAPKLFRAPLLRTNLSYQVIRVSDSKQKILHYLLKYEGAAIIYTRNRNKTQELCSFIQQQGISATYYHGGLSNEQRKKHMENWLQNQSRVMVATNAFGMGVDKSDVRLILHSDIPESVESYFQEAGRAGRDGQSARAILLYNDYELESAKRLRAYEWLTVAIIKLVYGKLCTYLQIPYGEGHMTSYDLDFSSFCKTYDLPSSRVYQVLKILDRNSILTFTERYKRTASVHFLILSSMLLQYITEHSKYKSLILYLLRTYSGAFESATEIDLYTTAKQVELPIPQILTTLKELHEREILSFTYSRADVELTFLVPREDDRTINSITRFVTQQVNTKKRQFQAMLDYITGTEICKQQQFSKYFGTSDSTECGICSICQAKKTVKISNDSIIDMILDLLRKNELNSSAITDHIEVEEERIIETLRFLISRQKIRITPQNTYQLI